MSTDIQIETFADADALANACAALILRAAQQSVAERGVFTLVLAGGSTPERAYKRLATLPEYGAELWAKTRIFMGDERFVPRDAPESNFGMAQKSLLDAVPVAPENVFPVPEGLATAREAAHEYDRLLRRETREEPFDMVINGLGDDGHTASLFPHKPALNVRDMVATWSEPGVLPPPVDRITMTLPRLNRCRAMAYLVTGAKKAETVRRVLRDVPPLDECPAAHIRPDDGVLYWLLDVDAAARL